MDGFDCGQIEDFEYSLWYWLLCDDMDEADETDDSERGND